MKSIVVFLVLLVGIAHCNPLPEETYASKFDNIDVDEILRSERLLNNYMKCLLDKGRCAPAGLELKKNLPEAMENGCEKCTESQKNIGRRVLKFLVEERRDLYDQLEAKYDPERKYLKKYEKDLESVGIRY